MTQYLDALTGEFHENYNRIADEQTAYEAVAERTRASDPRGTAPPNPAWEDMAHLPCLAELCGEDSDSPLDYDRDFGKTLDLATWILRPESKRHVRLPSRRDGSLGPARSTYPGRAMSRMRPFAGEPAAGPWTARPLLDVCAELLALAASRAAGQAPLVIAIDGRSGAGKSTFAIRTAEVVGSVAVVHTDDIAWHHSFFGWADLMRSGVLEPVRRGEKVAYRPPAWVERGRPGAVEVSAGCQAVVMEGVGAGRRELADLVDALVWVQSDGADARARGIARDGGDVAFWDEWEAEEVPLLDRHRPWERADVVVAGSPVLDHEPGHEVVVAPALTSSPASPSSTLVEATAGTRAQVQSCSGGFKRMGSCRTPRG